MWRAHRLRRRASDKLLIKRDLSTSSFTSSFASLSQRFSSKLSLSSESVSDHCYDTDDENNAFMDFSEKRRVTKKSRMLAKESFQTMIENEKLGDVLIVEGCYILLGTKQEVQQWSHGWFCAAIRMQVRVI